MADLELKDALLMFQQGMKEFAVSQTFSQANQAVKEVRDSALKEEQKRAALQNVANQLVFNLSSQGVDPARAAHAAASIQPPERKAPTSIEQMLVQGLATGDMKQVQSAQLANQLLQKPQNLPTIPVGELEKITNLESTVSQGQNLIDMVQKDDSLVGPINARLPRFYDSDVRAKHAAFESEVGRLFDKYRKEITGAGASVAEIEQLQKNMPSVTDTRETFIKKMENVATLAQQTKARHIQNLGLAGYKTEGFTKQQPSFNIDNWLTDQPSLK